MARTTKLLFIISSLGLAVVGLLFVKDYPVIVSLVLGLLAALSLFCYRLEIGLYVMALSVPLINWNFQVSTLQFSFIEAVALLVLAAFVLKFGYLMLTGQKSFLAIKWPLFWPFAFFFLSVIISSLLSQHILSSGWYGVRWLLFFYLAYIVAPYNIIKDGRILKWTLIFLSLSGFLVASMGVASLYYQDWYNDFFRIQPLALFGIYPIGDNHNLIAEFLVIITFFTLSLKHWLISKRSRRFLDIFFLFLLIVTIGTFSRTAWIVLGIQIVLFIAINHFVVQQKRIVWQKMIVGLIIIVIALIPFVVRMNQLQASNISSTENRWLLTQIAWRAFLNQPAFGYGSGTFVTLVNNNVRFGANYGDPLDSHGIWQKVMAENGFFGVVTFLVFIWLLFWQLYRAIKKYRAESKLLLPLAIGALGGFIYQCFNTSYYKGKLWLPIAVALAAVNLITMKYERLQNKQT